MNVNAFDLVDGQSSYSKYNADSIYSFDPGTMVLPVASETSLTVTVRQHGGYGTRTVQFDIQKQGNPPVIPGAAETVGADRLVSSIVNVNTPSPNPSTGGMNWTVKGEYQYVTRSNPKIPGLDILPAVAYPYPLPAQDAIAQQTFSGTNQARVQEEWIQKGVILGTPWAWTVTSYPSDLLANPILLLGDISSGN